MAARSGFRAAQQAFRQSAFRQQIHTIFQRRSQATASEAAQATIKNESAFSKFYNSPVGPKTVHFWAPIMKWGLVLAGAADFARPASQLSLSQNAALLSTGLIWTRWCLIIKPRNIFLASVNFLLFCVGSIQVTRVLLYRQSQNGDTVASEAKTAVKEVGEKLEGAAKEAKAALK